MRSAPLRFIPVNHQYPFHGRHAQLNIEGDLRIKNGLAERVESEIVRYRITPRGEEALRHMQELGVADAGDGRWCGGWREVKGAGKREHWRLAFIGGKGEICHY